MKLNISETGQKVLMWLIIALFAVFVFYQVLKAIKKGQEAKDAAAVRNDLKKENLSYDLTQYGILSEKLYSAMFGPGTDESAIYAVFKKMQNGDDVKQLVKSFGEKRQEFTIGGSTLPDWLQSELSADELAAVNKILSDKNINISF